MHSHKPIVARAKNKRCIKCLKKIYPDMEWYTWRTQSEIDAKNKRYDDWVLWLKSVKN